MGCYLTVTAHEYNVFIDSCGTIMLSRTTGVFAASFHSMKLPQRSVALSDFINDHP
jgi:hypothetical protein